MSPSPSKDAVEGMSYEQAFSELEVIVGSLETNQKTLDEAIELFERGQALAKHCASLLDKAELRVRQLDEHDLIGAEEEEL